MKMFLIVVLFLGSQYANAQTYATEITGPTQLYHGDGIGGRITTLISSFKVETDLFLCGEHQVRNYIACFMLSEQELIRVGLNADEFLSKIQNDEFKSISMHTMGIDCNGFVKATSIDCNGYVKTKIISGAEMQSAFLVSAAPRVQFFKGPDSVTLIVTKAEKKTYKEQGRLRVRANSFKRLDNN